MDRQSPDVALERPWLQHYPDGVTPCADYPEIPLWGLLARSEQAHSRAVALALPKRDVSYFELLQSTTTVAHQLRNLLASVPHDGSPPRILIWLPNSEDFVVSYYASLMVGAIVTCASTALTDAEVLAQARDAAPAFVISTGEWLTRARVLSVLPQVLDSAALLALPVREEPIELPQDFDASGNVAVLQYTSGTTGHAKGAMMTHRNLLANALQNARWFGWSSADRFLGVIPLFHTWGMCCALNSTIAVGGTLVLPALPEHFEPEAVFRAAQASGATILYGSGTMIHRLIEHARSGGDANALASLRHVKAGAMLSQADLKGRWDNTFPWAPLQQGYGLTEASPECHNNPPGRFKRGTVGVPIQDTDCQIVDAGDPTRVLPVGEAGEVCLRGPQITAGYWRQPEATQAAFHDGWLLTGDIGVMDEEGYLSIVDRKKDLIKFRGYSIAPATIEEAILSYHAVKECVVVGKPDPVDGELPVAFVVLQEGSSVNAEELIQYAAARLGKHERPRGVVFIDAVPRNRMGKALRRELRARLQSGPDIA